MSKLSNAIYIYIQVENSIKPNKKSTSINQFAGWVKIKRGGRPSSFLP